PRSAPPPAPDCQSPEQVRRGSEGVYPPRGSRRRPPTFRWADFSVRLFRSTPGSAPPTGEPMPASITCSSCQTRLKAPDSTGGKTIRCPRCSAVLRVPAQPPAATARPAAPAPTAVSPARREQPPAPPPPRRAVEKAPAEPRRPASRRATAAVLDAAPAPARGGGEETLAPGEEVVYAGRSSRRVAILQQLPIGLLVICVTGFVAWLLWWAETVPSRWAPTMLPLALVVVAVMVFLYSLPTLFASTRYF